ncbi:MAG: zinc-binding dehydrogenase [Verrucomicrobia bacterium]|nr:zinc-binding dehydrogenase [Verrucomicrobiota bacterium]
MQKAHRWIMRGKQDVVLHEFEYDATVLKPREIAVRVEFTAISPGTECANYLALDPDVFIPGRWCAYPWQPGYSGIGRVIAVGSETEEFRVGDLVAGVIRHGTHIMLDADSTVLRVDPAINLEHASFFRLVSIAMTPIQVVRNDPLPTVGVWGMGMIGNLTAQLLQRAGGRVIGIDPLPERCALATKCGIRQTLDPTDPKFAEQVSGITGGEGFDITVDTTGHASTTLAMPEFTRRCGQMILMTHWRSQPVLDATRFFHGVFVKGITLRGAHECVPGSEPCVNAVELQRRKWAKILREIATGDLAIEPLISHRIKPVRCKEAYEGLCFDRSKWWGVVVDWRE